MIRFSVLLVLTATLFSPNVLASEITSKNGNDPNFIQVIKTQDADGNVELGFRFCTTEPHDQDECDTVIGEKPFYSTKELLKERRKEEWEVFGAAILDPVVIAGTIAGGAASGGVIGVAVATGSEGFEGLADFAGGAVIGGAVGAVGGGFLTKFVHALNPFYHAREAKVVSKALLSGEDIQVMSVEDYAKELAAMLLGIRSSSS
jgi:hypothetical protein